MLVNCTRQTSLGIEEIDSAEALKIAEADFRQNLMHQAGYSQAQAMQFSCESYCALQNNRLSLIFKPFLKEVPDRFVVKVRRFQVRGRRPVREYIYVGSYGTITDHKPW